MEKKERLVVMEHGKTKLEDTDHLVMVKLTSKQFSLNLQNTDVMFGL